MVQQHDKIGLVKSGYLHPSSLPIESATILIVDQTLFEVECTNWYSLDAKSCPGLDR